VQSDGERRLARLGDGNQLIAGFLDDIFPALGICDCLRGRCTSDAPDQGAPGRAQRRHHGAAGNLCPSDAANGATGSCADCAIRAYHHLPHADNHPTLHISLLLCGVGGIGVGGVACLAPHEGEREESGEQDEGQSQAAQGKVRFFMSDSASIAVERRTVTLGRGPVIATKAGPRLEGGASIRITSHERNF
jgi:hypothetical protein